MKRKLIKVHTHIHKNASGIERARIISEIIACFFVGIETHFHVFSGALAVWAVVDILKLVDEALGMPNGGMMDAVAEAVEDEVS